MFHVLTGSFLASAILVLATLLWPRFTGAKQRPRASYDEMERRFMPPELRTARLVLSEHVIWRRGTRPYPAKTDQGFLTEAGELVLVETKSRGRVSPSDIVQLTAQAEAVRSRPELGLRPAAFGYVRLARPGRDPYYQRVELLHASRIDQLWDRWQAMRQGRVVAIARPDPRRCHRCPLVATCPDAAIGPRR